MLNSNAPNAKKQNDSLKEEMKRRLIRGLMLRRESDGLNEKGIRLIDRFIYSTYWDLHDLGAAEEAQAILRDPRYRN